MIEKHRKFFGGSAGVKQLEPQQGLIHSSSEIATEAHPQVQDAANDPQEGESELGQGTTKEEDELDKDIPEIKTNGAVKTGEPAQKSKLVIRKGIRKGLLGLE